MGIMYYFRILALIAAALLLVAGYILPAGALALCWLGLMAEEYLLLTKLSRS